MKVRGFDFTSAPGRRKPITLAEGQVEGGVLTIDHERSLPSFDAFEAALAEPGPWVAAFDFPFGQPHEFTEHVGWPSEWKAYVAEVGERGLERFARDVEWYATERPHGSSEAKRPTDRVSVSQAPMKLYYVPVGRMFVQGAPRLLRAGLSVIPCDPHEGETRIAVEGYPALVARHLVGRTSYKSESKPTDPARREARERIVAGLASSAIAPYGVTVRVPSETTKRWVEDGTGDALDAGLCTVQAAWAWSRRDTDWGVPAGVDPNEGWITDPTIYREEVVRS